jgi:hypothetical protein
MKMFYNSGAMYMLIAVLFALSAVNNTISSNIFVITLQWLCAAIFALAGFLQLRKTRNNK